MFTTAEVSIEPHISGFEGKFQGENEIFRIRRKELEPFYPKDICPFSYLL
uniref:Uncharacterized protein n=1 Tax=Arundo donax TaxID=35708 RepID=A0A0A9CBG6_ARUDO